MAWGQLLQTAGEPWLENGRSGKKFRDLLLSVVDGAVSCSPIQVSDATVAVHDAASWHQR